MSVLVDTSIIIDDLRQSHTSIETTFKSMYESSDKLYISSISIGEIYSGSSAELMEKEIQEVLSLVSIVHIQISTLKSAGAIRRSTHISLIDAIIAATALELDLTVATLNNKDFGKVKGLKLYKEK